jgi:hypothetical protein
MSNYNKGYEYVEKQWAVSPDSDTARRLYIEADCAFDHNSFDRGMLDALNDLNVPDPYSPIPIVNFDK